MPKHLMTAAACMRAWPLARDWPMAVSQWKFNLHMRTPHLIKLMILHGLRGRP